MEAAIEMNNTKAFNMIVLGGLLKLRPMVSMENVLKGLKKSLPERHHHLIPMNEQAILKGMEIIRKVWNGQFYNTKKSEVKKENHFSLAFFIFLCNIFIIYPSPIWKA